MDRLSTADMQDLFSHVLPPIKLTRRTERAKARLLSAQIMMAFFDDPSWPTLYAQARVDFPQLAPPLPDCPTFDQKQAAEACFRRNVRSALAR